MERWREKEREGACERIIKRKSREETEKKLRERQHDRLDIKYIIQREKERHS